ncbi:MAG TPA: hypothetical protein VGN38_03515 [Caulobacteraceae bacterium]|jgi:hypothetical protein|nr:hypothetical protein [Caulobacteraceae bacterium]
MSYLTSLPLPMLVLIALLSGIALLLVISPGGRRIHGSGGGAVWILLPFLLVVAGLAVWVVVGAIRFTGFDILH